ncbi:hypothetical protein HYC85_032204, partial [Camellia sinensis]
IQPQNSDDRTSGNDPLLLTVTKKVRISSNSCRLDTNLIHKKIHHTHNFLLGYTQIFGELFEGQLDTSLCCQVKQFHELEREVKCVIGLYGNDEEYIVDFSPLLIGDVGICNTSKDSKMINCWSSSIPCFFRCRIYGTTKIGMN